MDIQEAEVFEGHIDIRYVDGSREQIDGGIYERKNNDNDTVEQRAATENDITRLTNLALAFEVLVKPLDATIVEIEIAGDSIDVYYDDGRKESLEAGVYEIKDANGDTIFERAATPEDSDRLFSLEVGQTGGGEEGDPETVEPNVIDGTDGDDRDLDGDDGNDVINGFAGDDRIRGRDGDDDLDGGADNDRVRGDDGNDTVSGGDGNDRVRGGSGDDVVYGGAGDDRVRGDSGNDMVYGGDGDDRVKAGRGTDTVDGGDGSDKYWGGLGDDTFVFGVDGVSDRIKDYEDGIDMIDISAFGLTDLSTVTISQVSTDDVLVDLGGGDTIRIDDVTVAQITEADFIF